MEALLIFAMTHHRFVSFSNNGFDLQAVFWSFTLLVMITTVRLMEKQNGGTEHSPLMFNFMVVSYSHASVAHVCHIICRNAVVSPTRSKMCPSLQMQAELAAAP